MIAVVNARAAARRQLSGVERWAVELAARLPLQRPGAYAVARPPGALAYRAGQAWEQVALPLRARRLGAPLILSPANLAPVAFAGNVVVIHDAVALAHPEWFTRAYAAWHRQVLPVVARRARRVITVSSFARDELRAVLGVEAVVVPGGVDARFRPGLRSFLERPYVLCVGGESARKNFEALAVVARALAPRGVEMVVAGSRRSHHGALSHPAGVRELGYVDDELLPGLYAGASAFVLPSRHEGFGLPVLESMASGTPVVATRAGALPETCGDAALLVDPGDDDALADAVVAALDDEGLARAGLARAAVFSWDRTVTEIDAILAAETHTL